MVISLRPGLVNWGVEINDKFWPITKSIFESHSAFAGPRVKYYHNFNRGIIKIHSTLPLENTLVFQVMILARPEGRNRVSCRGF